MYYTVHVMYSNQISPEQSKVLAFIRSHVTEHGKRPSLSEIQFGIGYKHRSSAQHHVNALTKKGLLDVLGGSNESLAEIPLVGSVSCGPAILAMENIEAYVPFNRNRLKNRVSTYFFLRARGDSMNNASPSPINEGDFLLVRNTQTANNQNVVIALIGDDATCKKLEYVSGHPPLLIPQSSNPIHKRRIMLEDFQILGVVEEVITKRGYGASM